MERVPLMYMGIGEVIDSDGIGIITLTDSNAKRALNIVCDNVMLGQLRLRTTHNDRCRFLLPEVLMAMLNDYVNPAVLEIVIYGIKDGQYLATLTNTDTFTERKIRLSDAVLLHIIEDVPMYIDKELMDSQSTPFKADMTKITVPINTLGTEQLKESLQQAVDEEDYRLASIIQEELKKRTPTNQA